VGSDAQVGPCSGVWVGRFDDDVEGRAGVEGVGELELDSVVARGGDRSEALAELRVADVVVKEALLADLCLARAEGFEVKGGGDLAVGEGECFGRGKDSEDGPGEKGGVLKKGFLLEGVEGRKEVGVGLVEESLAAGALGSGSGGFVDGEGKDGSEEEISSFVGSSIGVSEDLGKGKDTETSETGGKANDRAGFVVKGMDGGTEAEDFSGETDVEFHPAVFEVIGAKGALEMAKVLLDTLAKEDEGGLEGELREFVDDDLLLLDLLLQEVPPELS
jgi:hypothetical protein